MDSATKLLHDVTNIIYTVGFGILAVVILLIVVMIASAVLSEIFNRSQPRTKRNQAAFEASVTLAYDPADEEMAQAVRYARIARHQGVLRLYTLHSGQYFEADACRAICNTVRTKDHQAPEAGCTCGFYSLNDYEKLLKAAGKGNDLCVLEVRIWGKTIEANNGLRAEWQQVMEIYLPATCNHGRCLRPAKRMGNGTIGIAAPETEDKTPKPEASLRLVPLCVHHAKNYAHTYTVEELRNALQTDVNWTTPPT